MILVSIGSTKFSFLRLQINLKNLNKNRCKFKNQFMATDKFINSIKKAKKIIVHGGPATVYLIAKYAKFLPLVIPRLEKYGEHVDNHQFFFVQYLRKNLPDNLKKYFLINEQIDSSIEDYLKEKGKFNTLNKFLFLNKRKDLLVKNLKAYIEK